MKKVAVFAITLGLCLSVGVPSFAAKTTSNTTTTSQETMNTVPELKLIKTLQGEDSFSIVRPAFNKDGRYLAANLNESKSIRIWNIQTGEVLSDIPANMLYGENQLVDGLEFTKDSNHIVVFKAGYPLKEIDWKNKTEVRKIELGINGPKIEDYAFTPDYKLLVLATPMGIDLWDFATGNRISRLMDGQYINSLDISHDGKFVAFGKRGSIKESIGIIDLTTNKISKYPLANITEEQIKTLPEYQVRHVSFDGTTNRLIVGYMALPEGQYRPTGPAEVFMVDMSTGRITGPKTLSSNMLSFDPVTLGKPFNTTFFNTFEFDANRAASAADFLAPNLNKIKTVTDTEFNAPMLTFRVSPDQKWMAGSFKESDGKVRMRLYEISPIQRKELN